VIDLPQQHRPAIAAQMTAAKIDRHLPHPERLKLERGLLTVCRRPGAGFRCSSHQQFSSFRARSFDPRMIFPG
jgi:hypothetical protein